MNFTKFFIIFIFSLTFSFSVSAQNLYPNELKEYKLFGDEKLNNLKVGVSTKTAVAKLFKSDCKYECNYNQKWVIKFKYFNEESKPPENYSGGINLKPNPIFFGKIFSIILMPKYVNSFENVVLPKIFDHIGGVGASGTNGGISTDISSQKYRDSYGLVYEIQYYTNVTNNGKETLTEKEVRLESIEYGASNVLLNKMFIKTK